MKFYLQTLKFKDSNGRTVISYGISNENAKAMELANYYASRENPFPFECTFQTFDISENNIYALRNIKIYASLTSKKNNYEARMMILPVDTSSEPYFWSAQEVFSNLLVNILKLFPSEPDLIHSVIP